MARGRLFRTGDLTALIASLGLWFDPVPPGMGAGIVLAVPDSVPVLSGRVGHVGGLWVHPRLRGSGLALMLARLIGERRSTCSTPTGTPGSPSRTSPCGPAPGSAYGTATTVLCVDGFFPPRDRPERVFLSYATRAQVLGVVRETVGILRDDLLLRRCDMDEWRPLLIDDRRAVKDLLDSGSVRRTLDTLDDADPATAPTSGTRGRVLVRTHPAEAVPAAAHRPQPQQDHGGRAVAARRHARRRGGPLGRERHRRHPGDGGRRRSVPRSPISTGST